MSKKIVAAVLLIVLAVGIIIGAVYKVGVEKVSAWLTIAERLPEFSGGDSPLSTYNYERLSENEKKAYVIVFNKIKEHPEYIKVPKLTKEEFNNVFFAVKNDNPDILCFSDSCNMTSFMNSSLLELHYDMTTDECLERTSELSEKVSRIIGEMPSGLDDYEKELYIHDYIVKNCEYGESDNDADAYGCLVLNQAVCSGYSRAAMLLLNSVGIDSVLIGGVGISDTQGEISHMWNAVWIDGEPYQLDVTWDDPTTADNAYVSHMYFNVDSATIGYDHTQANPDISCTDDEYNYFVKSGLYFDTYDNGTLLQIEKALIDNINDGASYVEFRFADDSSYNQATESLINNESEKSDIYNIISYIKSESENGANVFHVNFSNDPDNRYIKLMFDLGSE